MNNHTDPSTRVINTLIEKTNQSPSFSNALIASLVQAKLKAQTFLDPALFKALSWPTDIPEYLSYLHEYAKWVPQESGDPVWLAPGTDGHQEVDDRLNHFYWLIDQVTASHSSRLVENNKWFSKWLVEYAENWGSFLDSPRSFDNAKLGSFLKNAPLYKVEDSMVKGKSNNASGWLSFNQFFARELNPGLRPIHLPGDNTTVCAPADCNFKAMYQIAADSSIPEITLKLKHRFVNIETLLKDSKYKSAFAGGTFVHSYLSPFSYHRFHTPVAGTVKECYSQQGLVYMDVRITDGQFDSPDNSEDGYQFTQARGVLIIDTANSPCGNIGLIAVVPIGMCQVSSVNMIATPGAELLKGDPFGYFLFGGSDIIVIFQKNAKALIDTDTKYRLYGSKMASCACI